MQHTQCLPKATTKVKYNFIPETASLLHTKFFSSFSFWIIKSVRHFYASVCISNVEMHCKFTCRKNLHVKFNKCNKHILKLALHAKIKIERVRVWISSQVKWVNISYVSHISMDFQWVGKHTYFSQRNKTNVSKHNILPMNVHFENSTLIISIYLHQRKNVILNEF